MHGGTPRGGVTGQGVVLQRVMCCVLLVPLKNSPLVPLKPGIDAKSPRCYFSSDGWGCSDGSQLAAGGETLKRC